MSDAMLAGKTAVVTGASRGVGKGIALGLGEAGATVYITGRSLASKHGDGSLDATAAEFASLPGKCIPIRCDHTKDDDTAMVFDRVLNDSKLDILVNSAWGGYERMVEDGEYTWPKPFWEQPTWRWDSMFLAGVRAAFVASQHAARHMVPQRSGLIVNVSFWAAKKYYGNAIYGAAKCATDRLTQDMAHELEGTEVTAVSLYPGLVRTEKVMKNAEFFDLSNSESPQFIGRAVAHLANAPDLTEHSGTVVIAAELADRYGFTDIDGRMPIPLTTENA